LGLQAEAHQQAGSETDSWHGGLSLLNF
jgi:hypothetical protein